MYSLSLISQYNTNFNFYKIIGDACAYTLVFCRVDEKD